MTWDWGIWYDDGRSSFGWLAQEAGNGRTSRWESDAEAAGQQAEIEAANEPGTVFRAMRLDGDADERFFVVRAAALDLRVRRTEPRGGTRKRSARAPLQRGNRPRRGALGMSTLWTHRSSCRGDMGLFPVHSAQGDASMIYVDELRCWPDQPTTGRVALHFGRGKRSCHLTTDGAVDELHAFAEKLGLRRDWFQDRTATPHYALTPSKRDDALDEGAEEMSAADQAVMRRKLAASPRRGP